MIVYFADRNFRVIGQASTELKDGLIIRDDNWTQDIETYIATLEFRIPYTNKTRLEIEALTQPANYLLRSTKKGGELYTITDSETDTDSMEVYVYAEDAGLELLNQAALKNPDGEAFQTDATTMTGFVEMYLAGTGYEIGFNAAESDATTKAPQFDTDQSMAERLKEIATLFGYEIGYSYSLSADGFRIKHKYVDIYKKRGADNGIKLRIGQEIDKITTKRSAQELATALIVTGENETTLSGYNYSSSENDYEVQELDFTYDPVTGRHQKHACLVSPGSLERWGGVIGGEPKHIIKVFSSEHGDQAAMAEEAAAELDKCTNLQYNYDIDFVDIPDQVNLGDTVYIVDAEGKQYVSGRVLKLERSKTEYKNSMTLGDFLIKDGGIADEVQALAAQFGTMAASKTLYVWIAYADDTTGANLSLESAGKDYVGLCENQTKELTSIAQITDPSIFKWSKIKGDAGEQGMPGSNGADAISMAITSSNGIIFKNTAIETVLTAHIYKGGLEVTGSALAALGTIKWYKDNSYMAGKDGQTLTIDAGTVENKATFTAQLEE